MIHSRALLILISAGAVFCASPWPPSALAAAAAAAAALPAPERLSLLYGIGGWPWRSYVGVANGSTRVGAVPLFLEDGPQGVADGVLNVTAFPCALAVAATFDRSAARAFGVAMGAEQHAKGANVLLGPDVNLARVPWGGRVFESFGEDPVLAAAIGAAVISGIQSQNVSAVVKHLAENAFDANVQNVSMNVNRRAHKQLYMHAFCAAVDAGVGFAMGAYNRVNGTHSCENSALIADLKQGCGFAGALMSDWFATHSGLKSALSGLDIEFPGTQGYFNATLAAAWAAGELPDSRLDDMVARLLLPRIVLGLNADPPSADRNLTAPATNAEHATLARDLALNGTVLLRNEHTVGSICPLLPLNASVLRSIVVLGDNDTVTSGSSGAVIPPYVVTAAQGLAEALPGARVVYADGRDAAAAAALAAAADVAVVVVATSNVESTDRTNLTGWPLWQDALVASVAAAQPATIVVVRAPGAVAPTWLSAVPALLFECMPGQETGASLAALILGKANPSGRLPVSFPANVNGTWLSASPGLPPDARRYPGTDRGRGFPEADFAEELAMGYRYYDSVSGAPAPLYSFGFGLSYANFTLGPLALEGNNAEVSPIKSIRVRARITHEGGPAGATVAQLYARYPAVCNEPLRLIAFEKVFLTPNTDADVYFEVSAADLQVFDVVPDAFVLCSGSFTLLLGASASDFRASVGIVVTSTI